MSIPGIALSACAGLFFLSLILFLFTSARRHSSSLLSSKRRDTPRCRSPSACGATIRTI